MANYYHTLKTDAEMKRKAIRRSNEKHFRRHSIRTMGILGIGVAIAISLAGLKTPRPTASNITEQGTTAKVSVLLAENEH